MKKLVLTVLMACLTLSPAVAEEIRVFELTGAAIMGRDRVKSEFEVNPELGRAWVKITLSDFGFDDSTREDIYRSQVEGLSFNDVTGEITLTHDGRAVTCAIRKSGGFLARYSMIRNTQECAFTSRFDSVSKDDGFYVRKERRLQVFLVIE